jgi:hypothetical protein
VTDLSTARSSIRFERAAVLGLVGGAVMHGRKRRKQEAEEEFGVLLDELFGGDDLLDEALS